MSRSTFVASASAALMLAASAMTVQAAPVIYSSESEFLAALDPGFYTNNFSSLTAFSEPATVSASGGSPAVSYTISAPTSGLFINNDAEGNAVGNFAQSNNVQIAIDSGNVYAFGARFYLTNLSGVRQDGTIAIVTSGGVLGTAPSSATGPSGFFGVIDREAPFNAVTVAQNAGGFLNVGNLTVAGAVVPEPTSLAALSLGAAAVLRRRRASR